MAGKKKIKQRSTASGGGKSTSSSLTIRNNALTIKYSDSHDLLDKLIRTAHALSRAHSHQLLASTGGSGQARSKTLDLIGESDVPDILGSSRAIDIVTTCASDPDTTQTIGDAGKDPKIFTICVQQGVQNDGYVPKSFPAASDTVLIDVVKAIADSLPKT